LGHNPYAPPSVGPAARSGTVERFGPKVLTWSLVVGAPYGLVAGIATCNQASHGLQHFGGIGYVPRVLAISALRAWGVWGAALAPATTTVVVLHRAGARGGELPAVDHRLSLFVALAVFLLYPVVVSVLWLAALPVWRAYSGGTARSFADTIREGIFVVDVRHGVVASAISAIVLAVAVRVGWPGLLSRRWWLFPKLLVVWIGLQGIAFANGLLGLLL
jgi:hypothetical protein